MRQTADAFTYHIEKLDDIADKEAAIRACDGAFDAPVSARANFQILLMKIHRFANFFCAMGDTPIGYAALYANDRVAKCAYITLIAVHPSCQGMHVGSALMAACVERARECGMDRIRLEVRKNNDTAIAFYRHKGFEAQGDADKGSMFMVKELVKEEDAT